MSEKILEIRGEDWMKGLSYNTTLPYGGLFQSATNFDPFRGTGIMIPSFTPLRVGDAQVTKVIQYQTTVEISGSRFLFSWAGNDSSVAPALYKTLILNGVTTDESSSITATNSSARGLATTGGFLVYARDTEIRSCLLDLSTNVQILTTDVTSAEHPFTTGWDGNLYFPNGNYVGKINVTTGLAATTGNDARAFALEANMTVRHLVNDGRYLVIMADTGVATPNSQTTNNCMVGFWDLTSGSLAQRFDFFDGGLVGGAFMDGAIYVLGVQFMYVTNVGMFPKAIQNFSNTRSSLYLGSANRASTIFKQGNSIYWGSSSSIFAYGSLVAGAKKVFYNPYVFNATVSSFIFAGALPCGATTGSQLFEIGIAPATNATVSILTANIPLPMPYKFDWAKITSRLTLASGDTMSFTLGSQSNTSVVTGTSTFSFAADGAKQTKIFKTSGNSTSLSSFFEELVMTITSNFSIEKIEVWGTKGDPQRQNI
jgi:hypothetical protein